MSHCHITRITQIPNLEIGCKTLYQVQNRRNCGRYIGSMPIYRRFWTKNAISVWMCQIIAARCRKHNIGAISGLYRGYLEHWPLLSTTSAPIVKLATTVTITNYWLWPLQPTMPTIDRCHLLPVAIANSTAYLETTATVANHHTLSPPLPPYDHCYRWPPIPLTLTCHHCL